MKLEVAGSLPGGAGVAALVRTLREAGPADGLSVGRVCGGRVAAAWLSESLELRQAVLEPHELDDAAAGEARAQAFLALFR